MSVIKLQAIRNSLRTVEGWKKKGETGWVSRCLSSALLNYFSIAVTDYDNGTLACAWLRRENIHRLLSDYHDAIVMLCSDVDARRIPDASLGGNYTYLVVAHFAWALGETRLGEYYVEVANRGDVLNVSTSFGREYARALTALVMKQRYHQAECSPRGQEKYWITYLQLIEAATGTYDIAHSLKELDAQFRSRNADATILDDAYEVEGSSIHPVRWDFRRFGLINYITWRKRG